MFKLIRNQSELSIATIVFLLAGGLFSAIGGILFRSDRVNAIWVFIVIVSLIAVLIIYVFIQGYRFQPRYGGLLMLVACVVLLLLTIGTGSPFGAINNGIYFLVIFLYLVWFLPMLFARTIIYCTLVTYSIVMVLKFDANVTPVVLSLLVTVIAFGELIHKFKSGLDRIIMLDPLTGVWNTRAVHHILEREILIAQRNARPLSLMFVDLDDFKAINDRYGHIEGDRVLKTFSQTMVENTRPSDLVARLGGDEFLLVLKETSLADAQDLGVRMQQKITQSWSFGVAEYREDMTVEEFIAEADRQMFEQKTQKKEQSR